MYQETILVLKVLLVDLLHLSYLTLTTTNLIRLNLLSKLSYHCKILSREDQGKKERRSMYPVTVALMRKMLNNWKRCRLGDFIEAKENSKVNSLLFVSIVMK